MNNENKESRHGKIAENNTRYALTIDKEFKKRLQIIADKEHRSLNNLILYVLNKYEQEYEG